ncbi:MAG: NUDIX hydrolase [Hespellia sp.]|nr:NUDIX hydrolase [Hespellia sp.]
MSEVLKRTKRELKCHGNIIDLYEDTLMLPGGKTVAYDFFDHPGAAAVLPVTEDGKILLVKQYRNALDRFTWEIPAGKLDAINELGIDCAARELEEETGYRSENLKPLIILRTMLAFCNEKVDVFVADQLIPSKQHLDEDEFIDVKAFSLEELKEMIFSGEMEDVKSIAAIMSYIVKMMDAK